MRETLKMALDWIIQIEGGYVNNPDDPGGETKYGISKNAYPDLDIKKLTTADAKAIYEHDYWNKCHADELPYPVDIAVFDMAVNSHPKAAIKIFQKVVNTTPDSIFGDITRSAAARKNPDELFNEFMWARVEFYKNLRKFNIFGRGWINRLLKLRRYICCE